MGTIRAPALDGQLNIVTLETLAERAFQVDLQLPAQRCRLLRILHAEYFGAACAFEMPVLMLAAAVLVTVDLFVTDAVTKYPVITGNLVRQAGIGQAVKRPVQCDAVHVRQSILHIQMRQGALAVQQDAEHFLPSSGRAHAGVAQQVGGR